MVLLATDLSGCLVGQAGHAANNYSIKMVNPTPHHEVDQSSPNIEPLREPELPQERHRDEPVAKVYIHPVISSTTEG